MKGIGIKDMPKPVPPSLPWQGLKRYKVTLIARPHGKIYPSEDKFVFEGGKIRIAFYPDAGFDVLELRIDDNPVDIQNPYNLKNITKDYKVEAIFGPKKYHITSCVLPIGDPGGRIDPDKWQAALGDTKKFKIRPNDDYVLREFKDNDRIIVEEVAHNRYKLKKIRSNHKLQAIFQKIK
jgi:hypothetical protein